VRGLLIAMLAGCSLSIAAPTPAIDGFVIDPNGAVANAEVHVTGLQPASCTCKPKSVDDS